MNAKLRRALNRPTGFWRGPGFAKHHCRPPAMPAGAPKDLIWRCVCHQEWRWLPAYRHVWSRRQR